MNLQELCKRLYKVQHQAYKKRPLLAVKEFALEGLEEREALNP